MEIKLQRGLEFARHDGEAITGNLYAPEAAGKFPALVAVHGGGWWVGSSEFYCHWGPWLAQRGYVLFAIDYRLARTDRKTFPEAVHDVRAAVQFLRSRGEALKVDPERIALVGDSAGAHLASLVALAGDAPLFRGAYPEDPYASVSTRVKACIGVYGVYDLAEQWQHDLADRPLDNIAQKFLGVSLVENRRLYFEASPLSYALRANNQTAFLLACGTEDDIVHRETQTVALQQALKQAAFFVRPVVLAGAPHYWMNDPIEEPGSLSGFLAPRLLRFLQEKL